MFLTRKSSAYALQKARSMKCSPASDWMFSFLVRKGNMDT